jgi:hypothetical protein
MTATMADGAGGRDVPDAGPDTARPDRDGPHRDGEEAPAPGGVPGYGDQGPAGGGRDQAPPPDGD